MQDMMADLERDMFSSFPSRSLSLGFESPFGGRGQARWAHQSSTMVTHNGVTHRIEKRRDFDVSLTPESGDVTLQLTFDIAGK